MKNITKVYLAILFVFTNINFGGAWFTVDGITYNLFDPNNNMNLHPDDSIAEAYIYRLTDEKKEEKPTFINIPSKVTYNGHEYPVTEIDDMAFKGLPELTAVVIPGTVRYIGYNAFSGSPKLTSVVFTEPTDPSQTLTIMDEAFASCGIKSITLPKSLKEIKRRVFAGNPLKSIKGGSSVKIIGDAAFQGCTFIDLVIPDSVTEIGDCAFWGCRYLKNITWGKCLTKIGYMAFSSCESMTSVNIPSPVKEIGYDAFRACHKLEKVEMANTVETIGTGAFSYCWELREVTLSNSLKMIGGQMFKLCQSLTEIRMPDKLEAIAANAFESCEALEKIDWGNSKPSTIWDQAFLNCTSLTEVHLPRSLGYVGANAFFNCDLRVITLNAQVSDGSFHGNPLTHIYMLRTVPQPLNLSTDPFGYMPHSWDHMPVYGDDTIHVYEGLKEAYQSTLGWELKTIIDDIPIVKAHSVQTDCPIYRCKPGSTGNVTVSILPEETTFPEKISYSSDNESVVYIEEGNGQFFGLSEGETTITVNMLDGSGVSTTCKIIVSDKISTCDVNGDGDINTADVTAVYTYIVNGEESGFTAAIADVNGDGDVNTADVTAIYSTIINGNDGK